MLIMHQVVDLIYSMGHTFDNLGSTYIATEEFLTTNNPTVLGSRNDLALLQDLQDAAQAMLHYDYSHGITRDFVRSLNASMTRTAALEPGKLRESANILVRTMRGDYIPPVPDVHRLDATLSAANASDGTLHDAAHLFSELAKMQPFGDGNKRTALLAANGLLLMKKSTHVLTVPVVDPDKRSFNELLSEWYTQGDPQVVDFLTAYNTKVRGLDRDGRPIEDAQ